MEIDGDGMLITGDITPSKKPPRRRRKAAPVSEETQCERYETKQRTYWIMLFTLLEQFLIAQGRGMPKSTPEEKKSTELDALLNKLGEEEARTINAELAASNRARSAREMESELLPKS